MAFPASHYITPEEYLAAERAADHKSEYFNGAVFAMAGCSPAHNRITTNLNREVDTLLYDGPCVTYNGDQRVRIPATGLYTYPDLVVVCGEAEYDGPDPETLLNPTLIVEVLSPSTEAYDRGAKFLHYQSLPSLQEYVLIAQDRPLIERYVRRGSSWEYINYKGMDAALPLNCTEDEISFTRLYNRVTFPENPGR
jgi:Uma2 family endonuclease